MLGRVGARAAVVAVPVSSSFSGVSSMKAGLSRTNPTISGCSRRSRCAATKGLTHMVSNGGVAWSVQTQSGGADLRGGGRALQRGKRPCRCRNVKFKARRWELSTAGEFLHHRARRPHLWPAGKESDMSESKPEEKSVRLNGMEVHYETMGDGRAAVAAARDGGMRGGLGHCGAGRAGPAPPAHRGGRARARAVDQPGGSLQLPAVRARHAGAARSPGAAALPGHRGQPGRQHAPARGHAAARADRGDGAGERHHVFPGAGAPRSCGRSRSRTSRPRPGQVMRQRHKLGDEQILALWRQQRALADSYDDLTFTPPSLGRITADTLIVYGDRDPLYPVRDGGRPVPGHPPRCPLGVAPVGPRPNLPRGGCPLRPGLARLLPHAPAAEPAARAGPRVVRAQAPPGRGPARR